MDSLQAMRHLNAPWTLQETEDSAIDDDPLDTTSEYYYDDAATGELAMMHHSASWNKHSCGTDFADTNLNIGNAVKRAPHAIESSKILRNKKARLSDSFEMPDDAGISYLLTISSALHNSTASSGNRVDRNSSRRSRPRSQSLPFVSRHINGVHTDDVYGAGVMTGNGASNSVLTAAEHAYNRMVYHATEGTDLHTAHPSRLANDGEFTSVCDAEDAAATDSSGETADDDGQSTAGSWWSRNQASANANIAAPVPDAKLGKILPTGCSGYKQKGTCRENEPFY
jgi:hypothetical protein